MSRLAILDKDGTLVQSASGNTFVQHPQDQVLLPGVVEAIARLRADGYMLAIASNQGGIAAGHKTLEQALAEMEYCSRITGISHLLFCPDFEGKLCYSVARSVMVRDEHFSAVESSSFSPEFQFPGEYRKPNAGMLKTLIALNDPTEVLFIGDRPEDEQAAIAANVPFMWADRWRNQ